MRHYSCLTIPQLCTLPLRQVIAENAVLFLCMPSSQLVIAAHLPLVEAWGFWPSAIGFLWVKLKKGRSSASVAPSADLFMGIDDQLQEEFGLPLGLIVIDTLTACASKAKRRYFSVDTSRHPHLLEVSTPKTPERLG